MADRDRETQRRELFDEIHQLMVERASGESRAAEERLEQLVQENALAREIFAEYMLQTVSLRTWATAQSDADSVTEKLPFDVSERQHPEKTARRPLKRRALYAVVVIAAVAAVAIVAFLPLGNDPLIAGPIVAESSGTVLLTSADGDSTAAASGSRLDEGATLQTGQSPSFAVLRYDDGSRVLVAADSTVRFSGLDGARWLPLDRGTLLATVAYQESGTPLVVDSPQARVAVMGTKFSLKASETLTDVRVEKGSVKVTRFTDGQSVVVPEGKRVSADASSKLVVEDTQPPPDSWNEDFEDGLPGDWQRGDLLTDNLPDKSKGAVRAAQVIDGQYEYFQITSPHLWLDGLFIVHPDSHLNVTYRMEQPNWINIFFITRTADAEDPTTFLHQFSSLPTPERGVWYTASIPLTRFRQKTSQGFDGEPDIGGLAFGLNFSAPAPDRGLVVDRAWVSRGGPGSVSIRKVEP